MHTIEKLLYKGEIKKAETAIARLLRTEKNPTERAKILALRARARLYSARPQDALADLDEIKRLTPDDLERPELIELYADCHFARFELASMGFAERADLEEARNAYHRIIQQFGRYENVGWVYYQLGRVLLATNQSESAAICFQQALLSPGISPALPAYCYERLGFIAFYETRDSDKANTLLSRAIDLYPRGEDRTWLVQLHVLRSRVLRDMGRFDPALKAVEAAVNTASTLTENRFALSEALFAAGELAHMLERPRKAIQYLQQFVQSNAKPLGIDVTWSRVHEMLGDSYFKERQYDQAVGAYQSALEFNPYHPWETSLYYRIACAFYQQKDYEAAIRAVNRIFHSAQQDAQPVSDYRIYEVLGDASFARAEYTKAAEAYLTALRLAPANAANTDKIRAYYERASKIVLSNRSVVD